MRKADFSEEFPPELLVSESGRISGEDTLFSIEIKLERFQFGEEDVDTSITLENVVLDAVSVAELSGREFSFPVNPDDGYIDTSIYLWSVHNPIDVRQIKFGALTEAGILATFDLKFVFSYEGCCEDLSTLLTVELNRSF